MWKFKHHLTGERRALTKFAKSVTWRDQTPLSSAAEKGHEAVVKQLLEAKADIESKDISNGQTALSWAVGQGHDVVVKQLVEAKADVESKDIYGRTPLRLAAERGYEAAVKQLLDAKADVESKGSWGQTSLSWASRHGHETVVKQLLEAKADVELKDTKNGRTPLSWAAEHGHEAVVKLLLDTGKVDADSNSCTLLLDSHGRTPLSMAAGNGHEAIVKLLLDTGKVDMDSKDPSGRTPLRWAAGNGYEAVVKLLLDTGKVDADSKDEYGETPLRWAAGNGHEAVVKLLLNTGKVDADSKDTACGRTPLSMAARNGHEAIVKLLLDTGKVDANSKDSSGRTPLWMAARWAAGERHEAVVKLLLDGRKLDADSMVKMDLEINHQCLTRWIKACDDRHDGYCQPIPVQRRQPHQIPDWVIDTQNACIVPGRTASRYIALSYVWSDNQENKGPLKAERLMLTRSNLSKFQKPGYFNETAAVHLPQVVKDTISLARKLGERYLWVDCLCIIQHDGHTRTQVERMDEFYSGAYFTVIAAASSGLYGTPMWGIANKLRKEDLHQCMLPLGSVAKEYIEILYGNLFRSKWATRGWTFQEQILSKRAVIFLDGDMFWDCQCSIWDKNELDPESKQEKDGLYAGPYYEMARRMSSISWPDFSTYIELVCGYNSRDLTYPQDSLPAFSGILNSLSRSFPGGFVSGLPRLFLDIALLWQPFSKAKRRNAKEGGTISPFRHLPSWSWCGWQCPVDPFSFRTGLAYLDRGDHQSRALTWQTQRLVQWSVLSEDMQQEQRLDEPVMFEKYKDFCTNKDVELPHGWFRNGDGSSTLSRGSDGVYFTHTADPTSRFKHPVPIGNAPSSTALHQNTWPFLSCETTRAFFRVQAILQPHGCFTSYADIKSSVFELPQFTDAPAEVCHVLCLEDRQGMSAGLLRRMDDAEVEPGEEIELIAISSGSVRYADLESAFEERTDRYGSYSYRHNLMTISFQRVLPGGSIDMSEWKSSHPERAVSHPTMDGESGVDYHFYNVLWIERKGDIAYRRAAGRVPKVVWEENCSEPLRVVLG